MLEKLTKPTNLTTFEPMPESPRYRARLEHAKEMAAKATSPKDKERANNVAHIYKHLLECNNRHSKVPAHLICKQWGKQTEWTHNTADDPNGR